MRRTKRLLYAPGLISLIGLAITLPSFYKKNFPVKKYCLQLFVPNDKPDKNSFNYTFSKYRLEKEINKKGKLKFVFDKQDTSTVILINFTDSITYGDFVSILDMCIADDHKRYASWDNKFVIWGE